MLWNLGNEKTLYKHNFEYFHKNNTEKQNNDDEAPMAR